MAPRYTITSRARNSSTVAAQRASGGGVRTKNSFEPTRERDSQNRNNTTDATKKAKSVMDKVEGVATASKVDVGKSTKVRA